jgi:prepilin-type N-terminal cleavage/methylation domain-containing protein
MHKGFTLIELLIVVAIIAILAAIAVPNFLEAQVRSKVSRAKADLRTLTTGLEAYCTDYNAYPLCNNEILDAWRPGVDPAVPPGSDQTKILERLSTPVAYITGSLLKDPFTPNGKYSNFSPASHQGTYADWTGSPRLVRFLEYKYGATKANAGPSTGFADVTGTNEKAVAYMLSCSGPDRAFSAPSTLMTSTDYAVVSAHFYDPTNGTVSFGEIWRVGGMAYPAGGNWGGVFYSLAKSRN